MPSHQALHLHIRRRHVHDGAALHAQYRRAHQRRAQQRDDGADTQGRLASMGLSISVLRAMAREHLSLAMEHDATAELRLSSLRMSIEQLMGQRRALQAGLAGDAVPPPMQEHAVHPDASAAKRRRNIRRRRTTMQRPSTKQRYVLTPDLVLYQVHEVTEVETGTTRQVIDLESGRRIGHIIHVD